MFRVFRRKKIATWEIELLKNVIATLPPEYCNALMRQIEDGLLKGVLTNVSDISGYVAFTFNSQVLRKYDNDREKDYIITDIKVYDEKSLSFLNYTIYVSSGTISGYSLDQSSNNVKISTDKIDLSLVKKEYTSSPEYDKIQNILSPSEKELINPNEVYSVILNGTKYYHLRDLEDGDFIGIDTEKNVYKLTHDPFEVLLLDKPLEDVLKKLGQ